MKTGRVRKKEQPTTPEPEPQESAAEVQAPAAEPVPKPSRPKASTKKAKPRPAASTPQQPKRNKTPTLVFIGLGVIFVCFILFAIVMTLRGGADEWVKATRVNGVWTTTVSVMGPQTTIEQMWETECTNSPNGTVHFGSCILKDSDTYQDKVVDDYEEYAYDIYYDEMWGQVYQAQGANFTATSLSSDDWWEGNLHYTRQEELDKDSCQYTTYAIWVDDRQNSQQEVEVYLSECEVWDHIVANERIYDQKSWCQCDVTTLVEIGQQTEQGTGLDIHWSDPNIPTGGRTQRSFKGQATFLGDDHTYTTTTDDLAQYQDYLMSTYYIGLRDGKPVTVSKNPKD